MNIPPFSDFLSSIAQEKLEYDLSFFSTQDMKESYNPFTKEQYSLLVKTNLAITKAFLAQYHQWISEQLDE